MYFVLKWPNNCSIFDPGHNDLNNAQVQTAEFKNVPDGWETISKNQEGNVWEMSQREEDILLQEFERRIAYSKFQVCIKTIDCHVDFLIPIQSIGILYRNHVV